MSRRTPNYKTTQHTRMGKHASDLATTPRRSPLSCRLDSALSTCGLSHDVWFAQRGGPCVFAVASATFGYIGHGSRGMDSQSDEGETAAETKCEAADAHDGRRNGQRAEKDEQQHGASSTCTESAEERHAHGRSWGDPLGKRTCRWRRRQGPLGARGPALARRAPCITRHTPRGASGLPRVVACRCPATLAPARRSP